MSEEQQRADAFGQWMQFWQASADNWQRSVQQTAASPSPGAPEWLNPMDNWKQWTEQWTQAMGQMQGGQPFASAMPGVGAQTLGRMGPGSELFQQMGQVWLKSVLEAAGKGPQAWQDALNPDSLQEMQAVWQQQIARFAESAAMQPFGPAASTWMGGLMNLSALGQTVGGRLAVPWGDVARDLGVAWQQAMRGDHEAMREFTKTWKETYNRTYGKLLHAPTLGYSREPQERIMRSVDAYVDYLAAVHEFTTVLEKVGRQAGQRWLGKVSDLASDGTIPSHRTIYRLYVSTFEDNYAEVFRSPEYSVLQAQMVEAGTRFKRRLDSALEDVIEVLPVPTDSEMKELYQAFYELRKTVKQQQRRIEELERLVAKGQ
jgi:class III poly(R)-hydroxyalkanoic acid synthase PhaE subunit